jgi:hypothetical protein
MMQPESDSEDMIESKPKSGHGTEMRRRLALLVPASMGRRLVAGIAAATLVLGLVAGFLVGNISGAEPTERMEPTQAQAQEGAPPDGGYIPIIPDGAREEAVVVAFGAGFLNPLDLEDIGEAVLSSSYGLVEPSGLDGLCGVVSGPESAPFPQGPSGEYTVFGSVSFLLAGASLTERIGPDLDVLAPSTLRGTVELAQSCSATGGVTVRTDGIQTGIGDEYAVFSVDRVDPATGVARMSIVVLIRVGGRLIELTLSSAGSAEVPDGLARALRIAELAVTRMLNG